MICMTLLTTQTVFCSCSPPCFLSCTEQNLYSQLILSSQVCQEVLHTMCWLKSQAVHCSQSVLWLDFLYRTLELQGGYVVLQPQHHYLLLLLLIFCVSECFACIYVIALRVHAWCPWWSVEEIRLPETGVTYGCDSPSRYWQSNPILCKCESSLRPYPGPYYFRILQYDLAIKIIYICSVPLDILMHICIVITALKLPYFQLRKSIA